MRKTTIFKAIIITSAVLAAIAGCVNRKQLEKQWYEATTQIQPLKTDPIIRVEHKAHSLGVTQSVLNSSGDVYFTVSKDKTLRVWDVASGRMVKVIRPPIGDGGEGELYALDVSPTGHLVAIGGHTGIDWKNEGNGKGYVYLIDWVAEKIVRRIGPVSAKVHRLSFSPDGKRLAVIASNDTGEHLISSTANILIFSVDSGNCLFRGLGNEHPKQIKYLSDGNLFVFTGSAKVGFISSKAGYENQFFLYDENFKQISQKTITSMSDPLIEYKILSAKMKTGAPLDHPLSNGNDISRITLDKQHSHLVIYRKYMRPTIFEYPSLALSDTQLQDLDMHKYNKVKVAVMAPPTTFVMGTQGDGGSAFMDLFISKKADVIEVRKKYMGDLTSEGYREILRFNLEDRRLVPAEKTQYGLYGYKTNKKDISHFLRFKSRHFRNEKRLSGIGRLLTKNERYLLVSSRMTKHIVLIDTHGETASAAPTIAWDKLMEIHVTAAAFTPDNRIMVTVQADDTIRWYDLKTGTLLWSYYKVPEGNEWVIWTPEGYYDSSPNGDTFIGWHVNRGRDQLSDFYSAQQFERIFFNPAKINRLLDKGASSIDNDGYSIKRFDRIAPPKVRLSGVTPGMTVSHSKTDVTIDASSASPMADINVYVNDIPVLPAKTRALALNEQRSFSKNVSIPLLGTTNRVRVEVNNQFGMGIKETILHLIPNQVPNKRGNLYLLSIGVNQFTGLSGANLEYAAQDAKGFVQYFTTQKGKMFNHIYVKELSDYSDTPPTKANIIQSLSFLGQSNPTDTVIIFLASHGISDIHGNYYFVPRDANMSDIRALSQTKGDPLSLVGWNNFFSAMKSASGKRLLIVDTCQAKRIQGTMSLHSLAKRSASSLFGLLTASKEDEESQEYPAGRHGLFTYALLNSMDDESDMNNDGIVTIKEMFAQTGLFVEKNRINKELPQTPQLIATNFIQDIPVYLLTSDEKRKHQDRKNKSIEKEKKRIENELQHINFQFDWKSAI